LENSTRVTDTARDARTCVEAGGKQPDRSYFQLGIFHAVIFTLGILSMGFQIVASRELAPSFGSSIIVWSFLISTFLVAFSVGSFIGGALCEDNVPARKWIVIAAVALAGFSINSLGRHEILGWIEEHIESLYGGIAAACASLFLLPVLGLSALTPLCVQFHGQLSRRHGSGRSAGILYGVSTLGNIVGVMLTALVLVPHLPLSVILVIWTILACLALSVLCWLAAFSPR
jgi:hypothetical protein